MVAARPGAALRDGRGPACCTSHVLRAGPRMFCLLKGVSALSPAHSEVRGVAARGIGSQAELMAPDRDERG